ncbi:MAG: S1/P1 nuclease, partial [Bryobacteraceae bacterium]
MRRMGIAVCMMVLYLASPAAAWNGTGHRIVAAIAYARLAPRVRAHVDELIREHPDYSRFIEGAPEEPRARARAAFISAATWPDRIKGDPRFWDESRKDSHPTPLLTGFPDMERHGNWHYFDTPFAPDGARAPNPLPPTALSELRRLLREFAHEPEAAAAYDLPWIEHIVGDLHQPLHCIDRYLESQPQGDAGGNRVYLAPRGNLHALWDAAAGTDQS